MLPSPLPRQLINSLRREPQRWSYVATRLERDDGVTLRVSPGYSGRGRTMPLVNPRDVGSSWLENRLLRRAIRAWEHRPIAENQLAA